jgi:hypothetical protein
MSQNTCAEEMLTIAARRSGLAVIHFNNNPNNDHQIPLNTALLIPDELIVSKDRVMFKKLIDGLDKNQSYILRTGTNSGAGHWSLLQFLPNQGWQLYSTSTNNRMLTTQDNTLIEDGVYSLLGNPKGTAKWGAEMDEYAIHIWAATPRRVIDCTNFVCGFRSSPSPDAYECEDAGTQLMEACGGHFVKDHPYVNITRPFAAPPAFTMEKFSDDLDMAFFILQQPDGAAFALTMIEESLKSLANRADGEAVIRGRIGPQFEAANDDKTILNALDSIKRMCQLPITAQAPISKETTLEELDSLLDELFHPDNRHQSKTVSEIVIACLMNMREPREGAELILKRIEPYIGAAEAEHAEYKATLEEIQEMVQSINSFRPR